MCFWITNSQYIMAVLCKCCPIKVLITGDFFLLKLKSNLIQLKSKTQDCWSAIKVTLTRKFIDFKNFAFLVKSERNRERFFLTFILLSESCSHHLTKKSFQRLNSIYKFELNYLKFNSKISWTHVNPYCKVDVLFWLKVNYRCKCDIVCT